GPREWLALENEAVLVAAGAPKRSLQALRVRQRCQPRDGNCGCTADRQSLPEEFPSIAVVHDIALHWEHRPETGGQHSTPAVLPWQGSSPGFGLDLAAPHDR